MRDQNSSFAIAWNSTSEKRLDVSPQLHPGQLGPPPCICMQFAGKFARPGVKQRSSGEIREMGVHQQDALEIPRPLVRWCISRPIRVSRFTLVAVNTFIPLESINMPSIRLTPTAWTWKSISSSSLGVGL